MLLLDLVVEEKLLWDFGQDYVSLVVVAPSSNCSQRLLGDAKTRLALGKVVLVARYFQVYVFGLLQRPGFELYPSLKAKQNMHKLLRSQVWTGP